MSDPDHNPQDPPLDENVEAAEAAPESAPPELPTAGEWAKAQADIEALTAELRDQQLRAAAELENVRKRAQRDVEQSVKFGTEKLLSDLLAIGDSLEQGLKSGAEATAQSVLEGVKLTQRQLNTMLEKHGVTVVDPVGEAFDPELHEAMTVVETGEVPPNHVVQVVQTGYCLHQRLLRPARVIVAKPPAKTG